MRDPLPAPATQVDMYLHDIALSLRLLNHAVAQLAAGNQPAAATAGNAQEDASSEDDLILTPLREQAPPKRRKQ